jgi:hypothetical protein
MALGREFTPAGAMIDSWTSGTAAAAFVLYVLALISRIHSSPAAGLSPAAPSSWIRIEALAWLALAAHFVFAFQEHHRWSHAAAEEHVARVTERTTGLDWGGGIYFNHALLIVWGVVILRRWKGWSLCEQGPATVDRLIDFYVALMWIAATIVFGTIGFRVLGIAGFAFVSLAFWHARGQSRADESPASPQTQH